MKISLTGDLGSGKTTVCKLLCDSLGVEKYSTGTIIRQIAKEKGMTVVELNKYMESHPEIDNEIDNGLIALSDVDKNLIIDSRMAWHFVRGTFKIYLSTAPEVSASRIFNDERDVETFTSVGEAVRNMLERKKSENFRYKQLYNVEIFNMNNYDLIIDTTVASPEEIADVIKAEYENGAKHTAYFYGGRLIPTLEKYDDSDEICVASADNNFYIISGHKAVLDSLREKKPFVKCRFVDVPVPKYDPELLMEWASELKAMDVPAFEKY